MNHYKALIVILFLSFNCSPADNKTNSPKTVTLAGIEENSSQKNEDLEQSEESKQLATLLEGLTTKDDSGNIEKLEGFEASPLLGENTVDSNKELYFSESKVFEFNEPDGIRAEFSNPIMVTGSTLRLANDSDLCRSQYFQAEEPSFNQVFESFYEKNVCGPVSLHFCLRVFNDSYSSLAFTRTPGIDLQIPCNRDSMESEAEKISINNGANITNGFDVSLSFKTVAKAMYITNSEGCSDGGTWESYTPQKNWTLKAEENTEHKVYVKFRDERGHVSKCYNDSIFHDNSGPISAGIAINNGAAYTNSLNVALSLKSDDATHMLISNTYGCSVGVWEEIQESKAWTLGQSNDLATVYVKFKDLDENETPCVKSTIIHDAIAPLATKATINDDETYTSISSVGLSFSYSGAEEMYITNTSGCDANGVWEPAAETKSWELGQLNDNASVFVKFRDNAGNESECIQDSILHDDTAPESPSILIGNSDFTSANSNLLFLSAVGASEVYITNTSDCSSGGIWETMVSTRTWNLGTQNGTSNVYAKFRDLAGNETGCVSDSITHDNETPTIPGSLVALNSTIQGSSYISNWTGSSDSISGVSHYEISIGTYAGDSDIKEWTNVGNVLTHDGFSNLEMEWGSRYFLNVRALDNTLNVGSSASAEFVNGYEQSQYFKAGNAAASDEYGYSVSIDGDTLVIGARYEDSNQYTITNGTGSSSDNSSSNSGAVYVYRKTGTTWVQEAYIKASNVGANDYFGYSVSISGDTIAVGAYAEDSSQNSITNGDTSSTDNTVADSGAVYIYKRTGTTWEQEAYIKASNVGASDYFGYSVSLHNDTLAVGAYLEDSSQSNITNGSTSSPDNAALNSGAVYVYKRSNNTWAQEAYIKASNVAASDYFGYSVSLDNDTLAVGAYLEDSNQDSITNGSTSSANNSTTNSGAVYVYKRTNDSWAQQAYIKAGNVGSSDYFGYALSLEGDTLAVSAHLEDSNQNSITNGTSSSSDNSLTDSGAVYVYKRTDDSWAQEAYLKASNTGASDHFGASVSIDGDKIVVGAMYEDGSELSHNGPNIDFDNTITNSGAGYVFQRNADSWSQVLFIKPSNAGASDGFGFSCAIDNSVVVIGANLEDSNQNYISDGLGPHPLNDSYSSSGAVYLFD